MENFGEIVKGVEYDVLRTTGEYYALLAKAIENSSKYTIVIGWDFDLETEYAVGKTFRSLFENKFQENPEYKLYVLMWSGVRFGLKWKKFKLTRRLKNKQNIVLKLATDFPFGGSHHAKVVSVDGKVVLSGGIDLVHGREDTNKHLRNKFQDTSWIFRGEEMMDYFNQYIVKRWDRFYDIGKVIRETSTKDLNLGVKFRKGKFLISQNMFRTFGYRRLNEIQEWTFELIKRAKKSIYMQNQYFASEVVRKDLKKKIAYDDNFDLKIMLPVQSENWLARMTIDKISRMNIDRLGEKYFYNLWNENKEPVYVHGKVMIVDDMYLKIGSANMADRSFRVDSEIDITLIAENEDDRKFISDFQNEQWLMGENNSKSKCFVKRVDNSPKWYHFLPFWFCELFDGRLKPFKL